MNKQFPQADAPPRLQDLNRYGKDPRAPRRPADRALGLHAALDRLLAEARALHLPTTARSIAAAAECLLVEAALQADRPADREALLALRPGLGARSRSAATR